MGTVTTTNSIFDDDVSGTTMIVTLSDLNLDDSGASHSANEPDRKMEPSRDLVGAVRDSRWQITALLPSQAPAFLRFASNHADGY